MTNIEEDDTGDLGLRKSKLSYHPYKMEKKYTVIQSDITYAVSSDADEIRALWKEAFGDEDSYINFYLDHRFTEETMLVIREDDQIVSMASFLDASLKQDDQIQPVKYVYAVATFKAYRRKGYARKLLQYAYEKYQMPLILQPGSKELFSYYGTLGFQDLFAKYDQTVTLSDFSIDSIPDSSICMEPTEELIRQYFTFREMYLSSDSYVCWDQLAVSYAIEENTFCGGGIALFPDGMILFRQQNNMIQVVEALIPSGEEIRYYQSLLVLTGLQTVRYTNAGGMILGPDSYESHLGSYLGLTLC